MGMVYGAWLLCFSVARGGGLNYWVRNEDECEGRGIEEGEGVRFSCG